MANKTADQLFSAELFSAEKSRRALPRFTIANPSFSLADGYLVQAALRSLHEGAGARIVGRKMGMTSRAKMQQMKIDAPIHGFLTDRMEVVDGGAVSLAARIQARVEPEIVFVTKRTLSGRPSSSDALAAVEAVLAGLEIIDSRYENYDFQLPDVVADNCSSAAFVRGRVALRPRDLPELANLGIRLEIDGRPVQFGSSAAILGDPARSLAELVALLAAAGEELPAGSVVLAGGATAAVPLAVGQHVRGVFARLGTVEFRVAE